VTLTCRARTTGSRHGYPIAPNRLARNFTAAAPNQIWLADLTYIPTGEGRLYLAAILDMHTRKIVGWSMRQTLHTEIALEVLTMAALLCDQITAPFVLDGPINGDGFKAYVE
jgi:putative transposase